MFKKKSKLEQYLLNNYMIQVSIDALFLQTHNHNFNISNITLSPLFLVNY